MNNRIHSHPKLEEKLGLGKEYVIIDRDLYHELLCLNCSVASIAAAHYPRKVSKDCQNRNSHSRR